MQETLRWVVRPNGAFPFGPTLTRVNDLHAWVTTTNGFEGYRVVRSLGIVRGITVRSRSVFGNIGAGIQQMIGGNITLYTELAEQSRIEAYEVMIRHAQAMGANAVIGMRYDATEIAEGVTEVLAYGTAVVIQVGAAPGPARP